MKLQRLRRASSGPAALRTAAALLCLCLASCAAIARGDGPGAPPGPEAEPAVPVRDEATGSLRPLVGDGGRVVGLSGSYAYRDDDIQERELFALRATYDHFLADEHSVGAQVLGQFSNVESDPDGREQIWAAIHYHYHWHLDERTSIHAGPQLGWTFFDDTRGNDDSLTWGLSGGLRHWLTRRVAFTVEPTLLFADFSGPNGGRSEDFLVLWGLAFSL